MSQGIHYRYCKVPRYASETSYYQKFKNEQLWDNVNCNENLVKQFFWGVFFWWAIFLGAYFRGVIKNAKNVENVENVER